MPATARRQTTAEDNTFTEHWEGKVKFVYDDAVSPARRWIKGTVVKGNLTAGIGHLLSPAEVAQWVGKPIPDNVIAQWYGDDNNVAEKAVNDNVKVPLSDHQYGALVDFVFNCGVGAFLKSTLLRKLNAGNYNAIPNEFNKYTKTRINGVLVTSQGLVARRAAEGVYWNTGTQLKKPANDNKTQQPQATEIAEPAPKKWEPGEIVGAGGTVATVAAAGFSTQGILSYVFAGILVLAVIVIGVIAIRRYWFRT